MFQQIRKLIHIPIIKHDYGDHLAFNKTSTNVSKKSKLNHYAHTLTNINEQVSDMSIKEADKHVKLITCNQISGRAK